jgi:hypothetical protein
VKAANTASARRRTGRSGAAGAHAAARAPARADGNSRAQCRGRPSRQASCEHYVS